MKWEVNFIVSPCWSVRGKSKFKALPHWPHFSELEVASAKKYFLFSISNCNLTRSSTSGIMVIVVLIFFVQIKDLGVSANTNNLNDRKCDNKAEWKSLNMPLGTIQCYYQMTPGPWPFSLPWVHLFPLGTLLQLWALWPAVTHAFTAWIHYPPPHPCPWPSHSDWHHNCASSPHLVESNPVNTTDYSICIDYIQIDYIGYNEGHMTDPRKSWAPVACCVPALMGNSNESGALNSRSKFD